MRHSKQECNAMKNLERVNTKFFFNTLEILRFTQNDNIIYSLIFRGIQVEIKQEQKRIAIDIFHRKNKKHSLRPV